MGMMSGSTPVGLWELRSYGRELGNTGRGKLMLVVRKVLEHSMSNT